MNPRMNVHMTIAAMVTALVLGGAGSTDAQIVDVAGSWMLDVTLDISGSRFTRSLTLEQDGERLTGHYSSEAGGQAAVIGRAGESEVTFSFTIDVVDSGRFVLWRYRGNVVADGKMSGGLEWDVPGGVATGTFSATRRDGP